MKRGVYSWTVTVCSRQSNKLHIGVCDAVRRGEGRLWLLMTGMAFVGWFVCVYVWE